MRLMALRRGDLGLPCACKKAGSMRCARPGRSNAPGFALTERREGGPETKLAKLAARERKFTAIPAATEERESARTLQPRQEAETPLLAIIKALV
jgi:hypothetical protein